MSIPVLCKLSGTFLGKYVINYKAFIGAGYTPEQALDLLKIKSLCCTRTLMSPIRVYHNMECAKSVAGQLDPRDAEPDYVKIFPEDPMGMSSKRPHLHSWLVLYTR